MIHPSLSYDVLVIDDELSLARNIKEYLEVDGLEADVCGDGEAGIELFAERALFQETQEFAGRPLGQAAYMPISLAHVSQVAVQRLMLIHSSAWKSSARASRA